MKLHYQPPGQREIIPASFRRLMAARQHRRPLRAILAVTLTLGMAGLVAWLWWAQRQDSQAGGDVASRPYRGTPSASPLEPAPPTVLEPPQPAPASTPPKETTKPMAAALPPETDPDGDIRVQVALARAGFSPGPIDGIVGTQTRAALRAFQKAHGLRVTGVLDEPTQARLPLPLTLYTNHTVSVADLARLRPLPQSWLGKSRQDRLDYASILELVSEKSQSDEDLVWRLNPGVNWKDVGPGVVLKVPEVTVTPPAKRAALVRIYLAQRVLQVFDENDQLLAHFPCSIGQRMEKRPIGSLSVTSLAPNPNYTFDPAIFAESPEAQQIGRKLILQPGPNNPVGTIWIGLDRPGYGIHGTPQPEKVGRTESHGCFRLANWNAEYLLKLAWVGMPVVVEE